MSLMPLSCAVEPPDDPTDGVADVFAERLGDPVPFATAEQLETFERGKAVFLKEFSLADGLGPQFNLTSCGGCHERPVPGGGSGRYRNFFLIAEKQDDGTFLPLGASLVLRTFAYGHGEIAHPALPAQTNVMPQRNAIPMFGVGLLAELSDEEIQSRADPDDADADGISGRPNFDQGFVGRFGRKSQTVSIEGFIRGPLFNHLGVTTDPLSDAMKALLPVPSLAVPPTLDTQRVQAAAPAESNSDEDAATDPEMTEQELFDLVSFSMLLAPVPPDEPTGQTERGSATFESIGCAGCHVPTLVGPRGALPVYSDLLLHDMGAALADGIEQGVATGAEFRTQPLWGLASVGPYLHDGRADTIEEAILAHGGEAEAARNRFDQLSASEQADVAAFLRSLGGAAQFSPGLLEPGADVLPVAEFGGPRRVLSDEETARFIRGRDLYDKDFGINAGLGPRFNGDSCRACHFAPTLGGAGPRDVNVMRHGTIGDDGSFTAPDIGTILPKESIPSVTRAEPQSGVNHFEHRQTPHTFGFGLMDEISEATILSHEDPDDEDGDGISGRAHILSDGRVGRLGWKAQVPSTAEFVRDAMGAEMGVTVEAQTGLTFGITTDDDAIADPELSAMEAEDLTFFITTLAPPPRQPITDAALVAGGEALFDGIGCAACHIPALDSSAGPVPLYSDLLLHEILPDGAPGIEDGSATMREFRTAPLWGLSQTAPYFHSGEADTIDDAIRLHDGEAATVRDAYDALSDEDRAALLAFLATL
jgi:CxxC motif-containing protein (DUF1111 family)